MKIKSLIKHNLMRAAMTLALILACATAWAQTTQSVTYIDAYGQQQTASATPIVDGYDELELTAGQWYVVSSDDVYRDARISVNGDGAANIILADGATFTYYGEDAIIDGSLNIYGQSAGTGKFDFDNSESLGTEQSYLITGDLTIYGGKVTLIGHEAVENVSNSQAAVSGNVTIYRGSLYAEGGSHPWWGSDAITGNVYYYGGNLEARGGSGSEMNGYGIYGNIYLSWSDTLDRFFCDRHNDYNSITIEANKFFVDEENTIHSRTNVGNIADHILYPLTGWHQNGNVYTISDANGWNAFCEALQDNETYNRFSGKTVKLGANITVTQMAGGSQHDFTGTFDGDGKTLTVSYGSADEPINAQYVAPFLYTTDNNGSMPKFRNLTIDGNIYEAYTGSEDHHHVGGLIGHLYGTVTIEHCTSNVTITSTGGAGGFVGLCENAVSFNDCVSSAVIHSAGGNNSGFIGWSRDSGYNISFAGCVFNGKLLKVNDNSKDNGGFIGWKGDSKNVTITNCLVDPAPLGEGETMANGNSATFSREHSDHAATINNCYYTTAFGTPQGKQMHSITAGDSYVTVANAGTATTYSVSGITSYGTGIKYNNVLYAGKNEVVSLTLSNTVPASFNFTGYSVTDGASLNGSGNNYTLTMPNAEVDVVITANCTIPPVSYIDENGVAQTCTYYYPLEGTETTLGAAGQETWCVVQGTLNYSHGIQLLGNTHIILCDGAAMNIGTSDNPVSGSSYQEKEGFYGSGNNLSLYAQSGNTGALTIYSQSCSFDVKDLTIAGGNLNATTITTSPVIGCSNNLTVRRSALEIHANGPAVQANDVTLSNVTANINSSNSSGFSCSNFTVDHSQLTVNAISYYPAIQASVITLGCTAATDFIKATCTSFLTSSYSGTVKIADGQTLYDGANTYTDTLTDAERQTIGGRKLTNVAPPTYDYIGLDGTGATHTAVVIDADYMPTALSGWYIVQGTVNYTNTIDLAGDTHIILADNAVMNVTVTGGYNHGIQSTSENNYSLFVYGQTGQSGELNVTSNSIACFISGGDITIAGGKVTASGTIGIYAQYYKNNGGNVTIKNATVTATGTSFHGILSEYGGNITIDNSNVTATGNYGIYAQKGDITIASGTVTASGTQYGIFTENGSVTINGGQVTATGNFGIYTIGSVTINGGQVTATGNNYGIFAQNSSDHITLGWTNPTDFIYVNKYYTYGTLSIADNTTFIDEDGQTYSGTIAMVSGAYPIDGKRLYPDCVVMKPITGYGNSTESDHWVFIASPVVDNIAPSEVHNLFPSAGETSNEYDLYRFNQSSSNGKEWQNWKATTTENHPDFTSLANGQGYLYASKETRTLVFAGEYTATTGSVAVPLAYDANADLAGWNLVGNPFAVGATSSQPYYRMNDEGSALNTSTENTAVAAMEGVFVQATAANQTVTFTAQTRGGEKSAVAALNVKVGPSTLRQAQGSGTSILDNAIIRFDGGQTLEKFSFREGSTKIYIPQDGKDYAIVSVGRDGACTVSTDAGVSVGGDGACTVSTMPVNFKAETDGTYTITVDVDNVEMAYLHLIDNMTGADIDLLSTQNVIAGEDPQSPTPSYTFTAKTTDYESRFKLVFSADEAVCEPDEAFAFISNGNIIVNGIGTLQVFDVHGHQLVTKQLPTLNSQLSTPLTKGVYVLRLINGENVRTQKIVVE